MSLFNKLLQFVIFTSSKHSIDESHGLSHSMEVLHFAHSIYQEEVRLKPYIEDHELIIYTSAVIHDMCDKKYMDEKEGILAIDKLLDNELHPNDITMVKFIISTMSYSKVKANGFPCMGPFQTAYNIVREADLLAAYDFDRCMIYNMKKIDPDLVTSFHSADELFSKRVLRHNEDNLFTTDYAKRTSLVLHSQALQRIKAWKNMLHIK
jgi:HD superfamily phosphodiesterase